MITSKDEQFFFFLKNISKLSDFKRVHIGCIVVEKHRIISSGYNSNKTCPLQKRYNIERFSVDTPHCLHAEIKALKPLLNNSEIDFSKVTLYTYRERANGKIGLSRSCPSCMKLIKDLGIKTIYYTTDDGYAEEKIIY